MIVWNDPINLMSYVTWVFQTLFGYPREKAERLMMDVHTKGKAVVSSGTRTEAERDVARLHGRACGPRCSAMSELETPLARDGDGFALRLSPGERDLLRGLCGQLRELSSEARRARGSGVARLFPPAYPEDPLRNLGLRARRGRAGSSRTGSPPSTSVETTVDAEHLSEDEVIAWLGSVNALRLVLGTRLGDHGGHDGGGLPEGHPDRDAYGMYLYLTWLEAAIVDALRGGGVRLAQAFRPFPKMRFHHGRRVPADSASCRRCSPPSPSSDSVVPLRGDASP